MTAMLIDNAVAETQTQAGALANRLGREKWIKNSIQVFVFDSRPIILKTKADSISGHFGCDTNFARGLMSFDRLSGIIQNIKKNLLKLMGVAQYSRQIARKIPFHLDIARSQFVSHDFKNPFKHFIGLDWPFLRCALPSETQ